VSSFDGTWRPDPQRPGPDAPSEELLLADATYACLSCRPAYRVPADGQPHHVEGAAGFDAVAISVVDPRTVRRVATLGGRIVVDATTVLSPFGHTKRETQRQFTSAGAWVEFAITSRRLAPAPDGAHLLSGTWQPVEADLPNHEEDTVYRIDRDVLSMRDGFGRSFDAPLDGTRVPYLGDERFSHVRVRQIDDSTIEEVDLHDGDVVLTTRWHVDSDGLTIHVRFEHADGRIQEQDGHRIG
jgi:hypothetical protein